MHTSIHHSVIHYEHTTSRKGSKTSDQFMLLVWGGGGGVEAGGRGGGGEERKKVTLTSNWNGTGRSSMGVKSRSQMTSHCNGK